MEIEAIQNKIRNLELKIENSLKDRADLNERFCLSQAIISLKQARAWLEQAERR